MFGREGGIIVKLERTVVTKRPVEEKTGGGKEGVKRPTGGRKQICSCSRLGARGSSCSWE